VETKNRICYFQRFSTPVFPPHFGFAPVLQSGTEEEKERTGIASDVVNVQREDPATPGMTPGPQFPQYRVNKTKQHTHRFLAPKSIIAAIRLGLRNSIKKAVFNICHLEVTTKMIHFVGNSVLMNTTSIKIKS